MYIVLLLCTILILVYMLYRDKKINNNIDKLNNTAIQSYEQICSETIDLLLSHGKINKIKNNEVLLNDKGNCLSFINVDKHHTIIETKLSLSYNHMFKLLLTLCAEHNYDTTDYISDNTNYSQFLLSNSDSHIVIVFSRNNIVIFSDRFDAMHKAKIIIENNITND